MAKFSDKGGVGRCLVLVLRRRRSSSAQNPVYTFTAYTNDLSAGSGQALGLTQVLVADDGTDQVVNLFGLDLILQDDGA